KDSETLVSAGGVSITVGEVQRRLNSLSEAQFAALGPAQEAPKRFVEQVIVPELLSSLEARQKGLDKAPKFNDRERDVLRQSLDMALRDQLKKEKPVTPEDVKAYYEQNKTRYQQPQRVRLWRILVDDEATARKLIEQAKAAQSTSKWGELARENSVDKATHLRQGDLGFVHPDGTTESPRLKVDAGLFRAAQAVKDGELVGQPVKEGGKFAVIWRRGSLPERNRTLDQERESIQAVLERMRVEEARKGVIAGLRAQYVKDEHPDLLQQIPEGMFNDGNKSRRGGPGALPGPRPGMPPRPPGPGNPQNANPDAPELP
ncbi:MAG TPA: peptidyl-prolyl cis-trans isomerase, partial [Polyangiaceae bacterium]|nr:peptidyl-prolyl cis-trans isomerase [Polyangiaceae bacterium]